MLNESDYDGVKHTFAVQKAASKLHLSESDEDEESTDLSKQLDLVGTTKLGAKDRSSDGLSSKGGQKL